MIAFLVVSTVVVGVATVAGWAATMSWAPQWGTQVLLVAAGVNLLAAWVSFIPLAWVRRRHVDYVPQAAMGGLVIRLLIAAFAMLAGMTWGPWNTWALTIWMLGMYLCLLVVETIMAIRLVRQTTGGNEEAPA